MVYYSIEDFYEKAENCLRMTRQEEIACARKMKAGDTTAREQMVNSYIPMVAAHMKRMKHDQQTLGLAVYCMQALEKAVDSFDFLQESETFTHRLSWYLRQATTKRIAER